MKIFLRKVHLYLALAAGLVIMVSCVTGSIMVFEDELSHLLNRERYNVEIKGERLPLEQLLSAAIKQVPNAKAGAIKVFSDQTKSVEVALLVPEKKGSNKANNEPSKRKALGNDEKGDGKSRVAKGEKEAKGSGKSNIFVYINPYTGKVLDVYNKRESFFYTVEMLHRFLLGGQDSIGKIIIGLSAFSFLIITITGLVLWWPKNKKILLQRLKFKTNGSFKRLNHDLHIVSGFYASIFLLIIITTGLIMSYSWINKGIFTLTGSKIESLAPPVSIYQLDKKAIGAEASLQHIDLKEIEFYTVRMPKDSISAYVVNVLPQGEMENKIETYYIDQYSGTTLGHLTFADKNLGQKIRSYVKPIHTGEIFGIPSKMLNFVLCLFIFSFPITGVMMWLNRIKKKKSKVITDLAADNVAL